VRGDDRVEILTRTGCLQFFGGLGGDVSVVAVVEGGGGVANVVKFPWIHERQFVFW